MKDSKKYYEKTINAKPSALIRKFFINNYNQKLNGNSAIDLGCGTGNDTEFLLEQGFKVTAIDQEEQVKDIIKNKNLDKENLELIINDFSKIEFSNSDLILANFSLFFVKHNFEELIEKILKSINVNGFFVGNFLGKEDDWNKTITTVDKEKLLDYFKDFEMSYFSEEKYYKNTSIEKNKFWHVYTIIAQKK
mgnify:CR=1 FL=1